MFCRPLTIDTAHLLSKHDSRGSVICASDSGNTETVGHTGEISKTTSNLHFFQIDDVRIVEISCADDRMITKLSH